MGQLIDQCTAAAGSTSCASPLYDDNRQFDTDGRLSARSIRIGAGEIGNDPDGTFKFTPTYNAATGLLDTLTYPISTSGVALKLQYGYGSGLLQSITDTTDLTSTCGTTCVLWTANTMNGFGQITNETLGNGVVSTHSYDLVTSWLTAATAGVGGGSALLNQSYLQDDNGNVIQRQNGNSPGLTESFNYDADNRLVCALLSSTCPLSTATITYDNGAAGPGNIWGQTGVGTYAYPAPGQPQPHAVTSITGTFNGITNPTFSYDANGNMIKRASASQNIYWSSYNYPLTISASDTTGTEEVQFSYGPDRQRWLQVYSGPSGIEETYYIGGLMDLVFNSTTNYRHYIYAGSEPIAVYSRTGTSTSAITLNYMLEDHQGGVSAIASNSGAAVINESFSDFGQRRNPTTWSGAPSTADLNTIAGISRQGYTFQTWLGQSMGLNHMNGRVQDAILGRFLSPDPHIPDPSSAQSYNRYSYVNNNPLTMVDPSGFCGFNVDYIPGSDGTIIDNGDGTFSDGDPVTAGSYSISFDSSGCYLGNNFKIPGSTPAKPPKSVGQPMTPPTPCLTPTGPIGSGNTSLYLAYTNADSSFGLPVPDASHTFVIAVDPSTGSMYATRGGPGSGPGGGPTTPFNQLVGNSGPFPGSGTAQFPDTPNNITGLQAIGDVSQSFDQVSAVMNSYTQVTDANSLTYTPNLNSNSYAFSFLNLAGYQRPTPLMNVPWSQNGAPSPNVSCVQSTSGP